MEEDYFNLPDWLISGLKQKVQKFASYKITHSAETNFLKFSLKILEL